jgi:spectinomycin phosphotransferase
MTTSRNGRRWFVTCDDLDTKPWLGARRDTVLAALAAAYETAMVLRDSGAEFVVAPTATLTGAPVHRVDDRHCVSLFPYIDGEPGAWGRSPGRVGLDEVIALLARLHASPPPAGTTTRPGPEVPARDDLEQALRDLDRAWDGGPLSGSARRELATHRAVIVDWLSDLDQFALRAETTNSGLVVTHGEPHPGNLIRTRTGFALIDWDTVAIAPRERDLWMLVDGNADGADRYHELSGVTLDRDALAAYRRLWALTDLAAFARRLRGEHRRDADAERAFGGLRSILGGREPAPYGRSGR